MSARFPLRPSGLFACSVVAMYVHRNHEASQRDVSVAELFFSPTETARLAAVVTATVLMALESTMVLEPSFRYSDVVPLLSSHVLM